MRIFLHEITEIGLELQFTELEAWVCQAVLKVDERQEGGFEIKRKRNIQGEVSFRKVDEVVVSTGRIQTFVQLICSRCANYYDHICQPQFSVLFCKDPIMAGVGHLQKSQKNPKALGKPAGQNQGFARHAHNTELDEEDARGNTVDITYITEDFVDVAEIITEQLRLQVPFRPLCKENCKGICPDCGTDLNIGRCACAKIKPKGAFAGLAKWKKLS